MKPSQIRRYAVVGAGLLFLSAPIDAQSPVPPEGASGAWWELSASGGGAHLTCDICTTERDLGGSLGMALGTYAANGVRVGIQGGIWMNGGRAVRETIYDLGVEAVVHPRADSGLHLVGGLGWAGFRALDAEPDPDEEPLRYDAVRLRLGFGWDLPLGAGWTAGNRVLVDAASFGSLSLAETMLSDDVGLSLVRFSLYLRYR